MYMNKAEQAYATREKGRFAKRPSLEKEIEQLTPDELKAIWERMNAYSRQTVCIQLKVKYTDGVPDAEAIRGVLLQHAK